MHIPKQHEFNDFSYWQLLNRQTFWLRQKRAIPCLLDWTDNVNRNSINSIMRKLPIKSNSSRKLLMCSGHYTWELSKFKIMVKIWQFPSLTIAHYQVHSVKNQMTFASHVDNVGAFLNNYKQKLQYSRVTNCLTELSHRDCMRSVTHARLDGLYSSANMASGQREMVGPCHDAFEHLFNRSISTCPMRRSG